MTKKLISQEVQFKHEGLQVSHKKQKRQPALPQVSHAEAGLWTGCTHPVEKQLGEMCQEE